MCIPYPGRVIVVDPDGATVETDGRRRRASTLVVPDVRPGDWVVVGSGAILRRLDASEAGEISSLVRIARTGTHGSTVVDPVRRTM